MARRFRGTRGRTSNKKQTIWSTTLIAQDSVDSGAVSTANLLDRSDWVAGTEAFERGATLERIRGNFSILSGGVSSVAGAVWLGIFIVNDDETAPDPATAADFNENDCIWSHVVNFQTVTLTSVGGWSNPPVLVEVDVKARRRLTTQSIVLLCWRATGGSSDEQAIMSASLRALVKKA